MIFTVYILENNQGRTYIGHTQNLINRLMEHNQGENPSTKASRPWHLIYQENFETKGEAAKRELYLKSLKIKSI